MQFNRISTLGRLSAAAAALLAPAVAFAQTAAAPAAEAAAAAPAMTVDKGDTTWMLISSILVLLMIVPGLALFYGGLVRAKNMLSVLMQVMMIAAVAMIVWVTYGYSLAFTDGGSINSFIGGFSKMFLAGVDTTTMSESFTKGCLLYTSPSPRD